MTTVILHGPLRFPKLLSSEPFLGTISGGYYSAQQTLESAALDDLDVITNNRK